MIALISGTTRNREDAMNEVADYVDKARIQREQTIYFASRARKTTEIEVM